MSLSKHLLFYKLSSNFPLENFLFKIFNKAVSNGGRGAFFHPKAGFLQEISASLWKFGTERFVPNIIQGEGFEGHANLLLAENLAQIAENVNNADSFFACISDVRNHSFDAKNHKDSTEIDIAETIANISKYYEKIILFDFDSNLCEKTANAIKTSLQQSLQNSHNFTCKTYIQNEKAGWRSE